MQRSKLLPFALITCLLATSCAHPVVVQPLQPSESSSFTCDQIRTEIDLAERYKREARAEDRFEFVYILIVPAVISIYNMDKAESAAKERIQQLHIVADAKNCHLT